ncbi:interferon related developmental regulator 1 [Rhinolophus ferrumequinum]|uniref:Interferon-related developmental regulator 1 n=1 Tax=Rhinolophus ferrumequinum TaxID=59479 RepID=A0A7J7TLZ5_RHIFE|nr:interferon related developmental regulator 1 [Rhinolophus ferrumequinum]
MKTMTAVMSMRPWETSSLSAVDRGAACCPHFSLFARASSPAHVLSGGQHRTVQPFSDEDASIETMSHCSGYSDPSSFPEDGPEVLDEEGTQEDLEYKLKGFIDLTLDKNAKTRQAALESIKNALASKMLYEFILERRMTLTDSIERCLKKGKGDERRAAAALASVLCIQLGPGIESEEVLKTLGPILKKIICDSTANLQARQSCATCFGVCCFIATDDITELYSTLECLENLFTKSYVKEKDTAVCSAPSTALHISSLLAWTLLLTICPINEVKKKLEMHFHKLPSLLSSDDVNMRIAAGESLALLFELARGMESDFIYEDMESLTQMLRALATDGNKHRAKVDKRKQRSVFRDVLRAVEERDFPTETVKFGPERMYIDCWVKKHTYDTFKEVLGSGMQYHLQSNEFLRNVFELGPPVMLDAATLKSMKIPRFERHLYNSAAFKARTKARSKCRDKRADVGEFF